MPDRNTKTKGGAAIAESSSEPTTYTLPSLVKRLGAATEKDVEHYLEGVTKADLIAEGKRVGTDRIDTDTARLYGIAADFFDKASEEQLDALMGVSPDMIRVAVWAAQKGSLLFEAHQKNKRKGGGAKETLAAAAGKVRAEAMLRRTALRRGLRALAAGDEVLLLEIDHANGTVEEPKTLGEALSSLVDVGKKILKKPTESMKVRLAGSRLTKAMLDKDAELAVKAREVGEAAEGVMETGQVSQADVDHWDGINLFLLGHVIAVFDSGHAGDPTIPRLVPNALRGYFWGSRRGAAKAAGGNDVAEGGVPAQGDGAKTAAGKVPTGDQKPA